MSRLTKTIICGLYRTQRLNHICLKDGNTCEAYLATFKYGHKKIDCYTIKGQLNNVDIMLYKAGKLRIKVKEKIFTGLKHREWI